MYVFPPKKLISQRYGLDYPGGINPVAVILEIIRPFYWTKRRPNLLIVIFVFVEDDDKRGKTRRE